MSNERVCRKCGCTENRACPEGCFWVAPDLCSACFLNMTDKELAEEGITVLQIESELEEDA